MSAVRWRFSVFVNVEELLIKIVNIEGVPSDAKITVDEKVSDGGTV